jgi:protein subunit release factor A
MVDKMKTLVKTITKKDFQIDFLKTGGPGGQHRNKVETAVRITHIESGLSVVAGDKKSQAQNKKAAFIRLVEKMQPWIHKNYAESRPAHQQEMGRIIRSYKERRNEIKDHRLPDEVFHFSEVVYGNDLDRIIVKLQGLEK